MSSTEFVELNNQVKDLCDKVNLLRDTMDATYREYRNTPSATNWQKLETDMLLYQTVYQSLQDARVARRAYLKEKGLDEISSY